MFTSLSTFIALVAGISVAVERVIEVVKGAIPRLANPWSASDNYRKALLQVMSIVAGAIIAWQMKSQIQATLPAGLAAGVDWPTYAMVGLMSSGGSGLWNHVLDIVRSVKEEKEKAISDNPTGSGDKAKALTAVA